MKVNNYDTRTPKLGDKVFGTDSSGEQCNFKVDELKGASYYLSFIREFINPPILHTGSTLETKVYSLEIPAGFFSIGQSMIADYQFFLGYLSQSSGTSTFSIYMNSEDSLSGAIMVSNDIIGGAIDSDVSLRGFNKFGYINSPNNYKYLLNGEYYDLAIPSINNKIYIILSVELANESDEFKLYYASSPLLFQ